MHQAMRGLMIKLLEEIAEKGLPGEHHFFITFDANADGVEMADWLHDRYPEDMTIVLQHWFEKLEIYDDTFTVTLNFGDNPEVLIIPWSAVKTFVDPSVEFGLQFETEEDQTPALTEVNESPMVVIDEDEHAPIQKDADVVSLDSFRKP